MIRSEAEAVRENRRLNDEEVRTGKVRLASTPLQVNIELTGICNVRPPCVYCSGKNLGDDFPAMPIERLEEYGDLLERCEQVNDDSFGEPLTHSGLIPLARRVIANGQRFSFVSNGLMLDVSRAKGLAECGPALGLHISFNAATAETFFKLTGRSFATLVDNVRSFIGLYRDENGGEPPDLTLTCIVMQLNRSEVTDFLELAHSLGCKAMLTPLHDRPGVPLANFGYDFVFEREILKTTEYAAIGRSARSFAAILGLHLLVQWDAESDSALRGFAEPGVEIPCLIPWRFIFIQEHTHRVFACPYHKQPISEINDGSWQEAWNGPQQLQLRESLGRGEIPAFCWEHHAACPLIFEAKLHGDEAVLDRIEMHEGDDLHLAEGWYPVEEIPRPVRWTSREAGFRIRVDGKSRLCVECIAYKTDIEEVPVRGRIELEGAGGVEFCLDRIGWQVLSCPLPPEWKAADAEAARVAAGRIIIHNPWRPSELLHSSPTEIKSDRAPGTEDGVDPRELGIAVGAIWTTDTDAEPVPVEQHRPELRADCVCHNFPPRLPAGDLRTAWLTLENQGTRGWLPGQQCVQIDLDGHRLHQLELPHPVEPGERVTLHWVFRVLPDAGVHEFRLELLDGGTIVEGTPLSVSFEVENEPLTETRRLRDLVFENHARGWLPCGGTTWSATGSGYPSFAREAHGCRITDVEGREYVDYLMGWGCALLGYAPERIHQAVARALSSGSILTLTHRLMPEVAETLCEMFPGAEAVTFGKNGSDVCTAAVRLARAHTGRSVILTAGYHGWQDWGVEKYGFAATGVPERGESLVIPFEFNNLEHVAQLLDSHRGQVAAVMLEPAGAIEGSSGPVRDADPAFLEQLKALAHREGALLIFDEIMTGFRYLGGSVQQATGIVPDLTCLGKALTSVMPLSVLVGRKEIFDSSIGKIFYEPTFKGEALSLAAAQESLRIYRAQDVPAQIWEFGNRLRAMVNGICLNHGVAAELIGPPFRMLLVFAEPDERRRVLMRTLLSQELFKQGVLTTQNIFLPCTAHDDEALAITRRAFEHALGILVEAMETDRFAAYLETPPLPN